jgi:hypothetical protein
LVLSFGDNGKGDSLDFINIHQKAEENGITDEEINYTINTNLGV